MSHSIYLFMHPSIFLSLSPSLHRWVYPRSGMVALYLPIYLSICPLSLLGSHLWVTYTSTILRGGGCGVGGAGVGAGAVGAGGGDSAG